MTLRFAPLVALLALAACERAPVPQAVEMPVASPSSTTPAVIPAPQASPSLAAPQLSAEAEKGEKGATNVLIEWARAIERQDWPRADAQWGEAAVNAGSARTFAGLAAIIVAFRPGTIEGAAGSSFYDAPVTVTARDAGGAPWRREGHVVLRRVNDVPGATPAQLRWHIERLTGLP